MAFGQVVDDEHIVAALDESLGRVRADIAAPPVTSTRMG